MEISIGWWIKPYPVFELILVIVIIPVIMNGLAFWIQDSFLMKDKETLQKEKEVQKLVTESNTIGKSFLYT